MGRLRKTIPRSRVPWHRRILLDPTALRYWLLVAALACVVAAVVGHAITTAQDVRDSWGRTRPVLVATRDLRRGELLAGAVRTERWPVALAPPAARARAPDAARAAGAIDAGSVITARAITADDASPSGPRRTVAVSIDGASLPVRTDDLVDVWATTDPTVVADGVPVTRRVAVDARVVRADGPTVVLAVPARRVADVAEAAATSTVSLVGST